MSFAFGPLTDTYGYATTITPDGSGGLNLTCAKFGTLNVPAAKIGERETMDLLARIENEQDFPTNWANLTQHLGGNG